MRALILSDVHANLEALTAVLAAAADPGFDALWNLGDSVGYGASPNQVLDLLRPLAQLNVRGNHDRVCCGLSSVVHFNPVARAAALWTQATLTPSHLAWLRDLPQGPLHPTPNPHDITLSHGSPLHEDHYILNLRDAWAPLQQMPTGLTFFGHTHLQGGFSQKAHDWYEVRPRYATRDDPESWTLAIPPGTRHLINPGAVGQPRDRDWRAAFALLDSAAQTITFHRVPYDLAAAQRRILEARLPDRLANRLREGR